MRRSLVIALLYSASSALALPVLAQSDIGPPLGSLYLSPLPTAYQPVMVDIPPFVPQSFYLVVDIDFADIGAPEQNAVNGIRAWEASVVTPPEMIVTGKTFTPPDATATGPIGLGPTDYVIGMGMTLTADELPQPLVKFDFILASAIAPPGFEMAVGPLLTSPQTVVGQAIWQEELTVNGCARRVGGEAARCFFPFAMLGNLVLTDSGDDLDDDEDDGVSAEQKSWTSIKSSYR